MLMISAILEPEGQGHGMVRRVPRLLAAKDIEKKSKFNGAKSGPKNFFFRFYFNILMLWAKCMPVDFEFQQGLFYILTNCQT